MLRFPETGIRATLLLLLSLQGHGKGRTRWSPWRVTGTADALEGLELLDHPVELEEVGENTPVILLLPGKLLLVPLLAKADHHHQGWKWVEGSAWCAPGQNRQQHRGAHLEFTAPSGLTSGLPSRFFSCNPSHQLS